MEGFADIEGPVRIGLWGLIGITGMVVILVVLMVILVGWLISKRKGLTNTVDANVRSPLEVALDRLHQLQATGSDLQPDPFVVEVSDIVRNYLEDALSVPAKEQTSEEFLQAITVKEGTPGVLKDHMPAFLDQCDLVKFARQELAKPKRDELLETAGTVVTQTDADLNPPETETKKEGAA